jgi:hypothetical protein
VQQKAAKDGRATPVLISINAQHHSTKKPLVSPGMKRLTAVVVLTLVPFAAAAQSTGVLATKRPITWGMIFALLFLMLGPIKLLGPFAAATKEYDRIFRSASRPAPSYSRLPPSLSPACSASKCSKTFPFPCRCCRSPRA